MALIAFSGFTCMEAKLTNHAYSVNSRGHTTWAPAFEIRFKGSDLDKLPTTTTAGM